MDTKLVIQLLLSNNEADDTICVSLVQNEADLLELIWLKSCLMYLCASYYGMSDPPLKDIDERWLIDSFRMTVRFIHLIKEDTAYCNYSPEDCLYKETYYNGYSIDNSTTNESM